MNPTVCFKTIGCRLNQAETAQIVAQFETQGWRIVDFGEPCDAAVINTCTITHRAERDCARWARRAHRAGARFVALAGCAVEHNGEALKKATGADIIAGQTEKFRLPAQLDALIGRAECSSLPRPSIAAAPVFSSTRALVKVQDGCNFRCSYCIVPDTRGAPHSRPMADIMDNIRRLADAGHREITLAAANLGCYHSPPHSLIDLLEAAETVSGIERIRIGSIESTTVEREVIDFMAGSSKLCRFLHLPLQSGDDGTLQRMRRRYSVAQYRATVTYAVERMPDIGLGTDVIVGFPGESDEAFNSTVALIQELPFSNLHVFAYSPRRGTPAADMAGQVPSEIKKQRAAQLIALGQTKRLSFAKTFMHKPVTLLIEHPDRAGVSIGWTGEYLPVLIPDAELAPNTLITCRPESVKSDKLIAYLKDCSIL